MVPGERRSGRRGLACGGTPAARGLACGGTPAARGRLPDFVVIGTMKSGSTTLYRWLEQHPACWLPGTKEPNFFSHDQAWERGLDWYAALFAGAGSLRTGEASVSYTDPDRAELAAERLAATVPAAGLLCVLRDPVERLRSHYRHEVQRGRERRAFGEVVADIGSAYVARSCYATCLRPWVKRFAPDQLCVVRLEDLVGDGGATWQRVQEHAGLEAVPRPDGVFNATATKAGFTRPLRVLWEHGLLPDPSRLPRPLRRTARSLLLRTGNRYRQLLATSADPVPEATLATVQRDVASLPGLLGDDRLRW